MSLSTQILLGLGLGALTGIFVGELAAPLEIVGTGFVRLLQMTVLPYMTFSLVAGLGRLTYAEALLLGRRCGAILLMLWAGVLVIVPLFSLTFPDWESASFFSSSLIESKEQINFVELYIPANPFHSLSESIVPAVVLFSIAMGIALIGIERKAELLAALESLLGAVTAITNGVVRLAPYGVFAIAASAAGTMEVDELGRLPVFLAAHIGLSLLLAFWVLPALVTSLTPFTYRQVVGHTRDALVTAFATGNMMVVLPLLAERCKELFRDAEIDGEDPQRAVDLIVPASFNFPTQGTLLTLGFVLFAGWFNGAEVSATEIPNLLASGLVSMFGGVYVAIPFLLDMFRIPADSFGLFVTVDVITGRFGTLVSAVHTVALAILGAAAMSGRLSLHRGRLVRNGIITLALTAALVGGIRVFFETAVEAEYTGYRNFVEMDLSREPGPSKLLPTVPPAVPHEPGHSRLEEIEARGFIRIGYLRDLLPWAFVNAEQRLVGFDVEMAHLLARDLGVRIEFVKLEWDEMDSGLRDGVCDIVMSGVSATPARARNVAFSTSYLDTTLAFVVRDYERERFGSWYNLEPMGEDLRIAVPSNEYFLAKLRAGLPDASSEAIDSPRSFFRSEEGKFDALLYSAEAGSAWTLVYPRFTVVVPGPHPVSVPNAYPMARGDPEFLAYVDAWVELRKLDGTVERLFDYWIHGQDAGRRGPRWSVLRDVLGWVE
ncbi:MAG: cation:dicarboxylase symporter family transporter [Deltaproteobacteria bacterium]|nr:cation:dicarboxylase symporter family transporter [Deltaproteobacteria bacterium]